MKKIEAVIREEKLDAVRAALENLSYFGMTITSVAGRGKEGALVLEWRVGEYQVQFQPKLKIEVVVLDEDVSEVLRVIVNNARTGEMGDGKIFVFAIENVVRVRTGEQGDAAI